MTSTPIQQPRAFVAGATGYTGHAVVRRLRQLDIATTAHIRPDSPKRALWQQRFAGLGADIDASPWQAQAMHEALAACRPTLVFALLGTTKKRVAEERRGGGPGLDYEAVDYDMTMMVLKAAENMAPPPRFVYLSALGVKKAPKGSYSHARWKVEEALRQSSLPWTIARPSFITGPDREEYRPLESIGAKLADGLLRFTGKKNHAKYGPIRAHELAQGLVLHALRPDAEGLTLTSEAFRHLPEGP